MNKFIIPIAVFAAIGALLVYAIYSMQTGTYSPRTIPSPLIGKPLPDFSLPTVADRKRHVSKADLAGRVYLLNVWASWCVACREEHPVLNDLARRRIVPIIGLNYKDQRKDAMGWLASMGDPYETSLADADGRLGIDLGVYGVPETFLIDKDGIIRHKVIGPITPEILEKTLLEKIAKLQSGPSGAARPATLKQAP